MKSLAFSIFGCDVQVTADSPKPLAWLAHNYGAMLKPRFQRVSAPRLRYRISRDPRRNRFRIQRNGLPPVWVRGAGELLFALEKDLVVQIQRRRPKAFFIHSAMLEFEGRGFLLLAPSGSGKSTTTWGLLMNGCRYHTDEMVSIDPRSGRLDCLRHALSLKTRPPEYPLPAATLETERSFLVPVAALPGVPLANPAPLQALFFIEYRPELHRAEACPVSAGEALARLYANGLNQLAHANQGLATAGQILQGLRIFRVYTADLASSANLIKSLLQNGL